MSRRKKFITTVFLFFIILLGISVFSVFSAFAAESAPECSVEFSSRSATAIRVVVSSDECTGYEVIYSKNEDMSDSSAVTAEYGAESVRISDLDPATDYYIYARSYTEDEDGIAYGSYSSICHEITKPETPSISFAENTTSEITFDINGSACDGYEIRYSKNSDMSSQTTISDIAADSQQSQISGLTSGTNYYIKIRSYIYLDGEKIYSALSTKIKCATKPGQPTISFTKTSAEAVRFSIKGVTCSGYEAKYSKNSDMTSSTTKKISSSAKEGRLSGLKPNTVYYIKLRAYVTVNGEKIYGAWSSKIKSVTRPLATTVKFTKNNTDAVRVKISTVSCAGYQVKYSKNSDMSSAKTLKVSSSAKEVRIANLIPGIKYYVQIRTYSKLSGTSYHSAWSNEVKVTAKPVKAAFSSVEVLSKSKIMLTVQKQDCTGYQIQYSSNKKLSNPKTKYISSDNASLTIKSLKKNVTYYLRVRAYRTCDGVKYYGPWSPVTSQVACQTKTIVTGTTLMKSAAWSSKSLISVPAGANVGVLSSSGRWYKVVYGSKTGYVYNLAFQTAGSGNISRSYVTSANYTTYLDDLIFRLGKNSYTLFWYVCNNMSYSYSKISRAQRNAGINSASKVLNNQGELTAVAIRNRGGICYNYAAFTKTLLERAGYNVRYIYGSNKHGSHCWVLIKTSNGYRHIDAVRKAYEYTDYRMRHSSNTSDFRWSSSYPRCS